MTPTTPRALAQRRDFGSRMRQRREELGWSQEALAERTGLHRTYISSVERGERNVGLDNIWRIAWALDVEPGHLLVAVNVRR